MASQDLYEDDFFVWTQEQAAALRAAARAGGRSNTVDWDRVAEKIEDMGRSEYREAASYTTRILEHLFKLAWAERVEPTGGWRAESIVFRANLRRSLTPTLRKRLAGELEDIHRDAAAAAAANFATYEPAAPHDKTLRWRLEQLLGEQDDPIA